MDFLDDDDIMFQAMGANMQKILEADEAEEDAERIARIKESKRTMSRSTKPTTDLSTTMTGVLATRSSALEDDGFVIVEPRNPVKKRGRAVPAPSEPKKRARTDDVTDVSAIDEADDAAHTSPGGAYSDLLKLAEMTPEEIAAAAAEASGGTATRSRGRKAKSSNPMLSLVEPQPFASMPAVLSTVEETRRRAASKIADTLAFVDLVQRGDTEVLEKLVSQNERAAAKQRVAQLIIKSVHSDRKDIKVRIHLTSELLPVFQAVSMKLGVPPTKVKLRFDGRLLQPTQLVSDVIDTDDDDGDEEDTVAMIELCEK